MAVIDYPIEHSRVRARALVSVGTQSDVPLPSGLLMDMPLLELVALMRPMARFQQRFLHDPEIQDFTLAQIVADPPGSWQRFCLTPGAGPAARTVVCEVVGEALKRSGMSERQIERVRTYWRPPDEPRRGTPLIFRSARK